MVIRRNFILTGLLFVLTAYAIGQQATLQCRRKVYTSGLAFPNDDFESYTANASVNALNGGGHWNGAYVDRFAPTGIYDQDDFESYSDAAAVDGLNGGNLGWNGAYVDRDSPLGIKASDDFESYADGASVDALNGGSDWGGAYVDR